AIRWSRSVSGGFSDVRTFDLHARERRREMARRPPADHPVLQRAPDGLPDAEEPQLLVDLRRDPGDVPGYPDRHRHHPGDALYAPCLDGVRLGRAYPPRHQWRPDDPVVPRRGRL